MVAIPASKPRAAYPLTGGPETTPFQRGSGAGSDTCGKGRKNAAVPRVVTPPVETVSVRGEAAVPPRPLT